MKNSRNPRQKTWSLKHSFIKLKCCKDILSLHSPTMPAHQELGNWQMYQVARQRSNQQSKWSKIYIETSRPTKEFKKSQQANCIEGSFRKNLNKKYSYQWLIHALANNEKIRQVSLTGTIWILQNWEWRNVLW